MGVRYDVKDMRCECRIERGGLKEGKGEISVWCLRQYFLWKYDKNTAVFYEKKRVELRKKGKSY